MERRRWTDKTFLLATLFWTTVMAGMASWDYQQSRQAALENAKTAARHSFHQELLIRRWASEHGGVYVPITEQTPPNPWLADIPERDITTSSGRLLTLLNPSYITRQLHELGKRDFPAGTQGHLSSLRPLRPENAPDEWEKNALMALEQGKPEVFSLAPIRGETYLRLMRPLIMEESCRKCHHEAHEQDQIGAIRGGISTSIPWAPYQQTLRQAAPFHGLSYGGIWLLGLLGIVFSRKRLHDNLERRRQDEQALRRSEQKYRLLAESTAAIPWEFDLFSDRWTYIAPQVEKVLGYAPAEWTNLQFWADHIHKEDREQAVDFGRISTERGEDHVFEYRFVKKSGEIAWLRDVVSVELAGGKPVRLRGVMIDLSEHHLLEKKLRQAGKMEAVGTLAAGIAHDFNNILTSLISFATLVKRRHPGDEVSQDYLQEILSGANRAAELTRGLLAYSRKQVLRMRPEDLNDIVEKQQKMLRRLLRESIDIKIELTSAELPVTADRAQLEQALLNLATNAQDAMPDGGSIFIRTGRLNPGDQAPSLIPSSLVGPLAILTVADTGQGITKEHRQRIFEPFFTTKEVGKGTGLGLAMVYGIIAEHGGEITVDSEPGQGSVFTIFLPLRPEAAAASQELPKPETAGNPGGPRQTVLVVEDEDQVRRVLCKVLEANGYQVLGAANGEEALAIFRQQQEQIALVVMDVIMPGRNGREIYEEMHTIRPELKALFLSGYPADVFSGQRILNDRLHFMAKPMIPSELLARIRKIINSPA